MASPANFNPFPESPQKAFLRRYHLNNYLAPYRDQIGRDLTYFGLPSAEMYDVELWSRILGYISAVERETNIALKMYRKAQKIGVRDKISIIEMDLTETTRLLAMDERDIELSLSSLSGPIAKKIRKARSMGYDVINIDLCGGFLYPSEKQDGSAYEKMLRNLIAFQAKQKTSFILVVTFSTRDAGRSEYGKFISETLKFLEASGNDVSEITRFYTAKTVKGQPPNLRRLRFCIPTYLHKISYEYFEVQGLSAWYYKNFFHTALFFRLRQGHGILGPWPPPDEVKELLKTSLTHVTIHEDEIVLNELVAPTLS